jgi:hypothetical protein
LRAVKEILLYVKSWINIDVFALGDTEALKLAIMV